MVHDLAVVLGEHFRYNTSKTLVTRCCNSDMFLLCYKKKKKRNHSYKNNTFSKDNITKITTRNMFGVYQLILLKKP